MAATGATAAILDVSVEVVGVGLLALLAGASDDMGKIVVMFMAGLWCVFIIANPAIIQKIAAFPEAAAQNA